MNGQVNYCTSSCTCGIDEGDCRGHDNRCDSGLICYNRVGLYYGLEPYQDVCDIPNATAHISCSTNLSPNGDVNHCSVLCPCESGHGPCWGDDAYCESGLSCVLGLYDSSYYGTMKGYHCE